MDEHLVANPNKTNMVVIKDYDYMKTMDKNVKWMKPTHLLSIFSLDLRSPTPKDQSLAFEWTTCNLGR